jgi:hypothetical protein
MSPQEIKEYCTRVQPYQLKVKVRLKSQYETMVGTVSGIDHRHFLLKTEAQRDPLRVSYVTVANITNN